VHRTLTFICTQFNGEIPKLESPDKDAEHILNALKEKVGAVANEIQNCRLQSAANLVIGISRIGNQYLNEKEPWRLIKENRVKAANIFNVAAQIAKALAIVSAPFIPFAAEELWKTLNLPGTFQEQEWDEALRPLPPGHKIAKPKPLFIKIDVDAEELGRRLEKMRANLAKAA
jgi:methionyl-tRNA synthetase